MNAQCESIERIESHFGAVEIDVNHPQCTALWLRNPDGSLSAQSLLWTGNGGYTYVVGEDGVRYESRLSTGHKVLLDHDRHGKVTKVLIEEIQLLASGIPNPPVIEHWEFSVSDEGSELVWAVAQQ